MDIHKERDLAAYSKYEIEDKDFRRRIKSIFERNGGQNRKELGNLLCGLPWRYCFKDVHLDEKQTMRSRAMHGEEKAMAKVPEKVPGGCLFTTSSPCEMCSKNAKTTTSKKYTILSSIPAYRLTITASRATPATVRSIFCLQAQSAERTLKCILQ